MPSWLSGIEFGLNNHLAEVRGIRLAAAAKGKAAKAGDDLFYGKLQAIGDRLAVVMRTLKSMEQMQLLRVTNLHGVPRESRYSEQQSIEANLGNIRRVQAVAMNLFGEMRDAYGDSMTPTTADIIEGAEKVLKDIGKAVDRHTLQTAAEQLKGPAFVAPTSARASAGDALQSLWLVLALTIALARRRKRGQ